MQTMQFGAKMVYHGPGGDFEPWQILCYCSTGRSLVVAQNIMASIHDIAPREVVGRETTLRFSMQHQAAAYAALEVLESGDVDRIYCDYHDDFVVRRRSPDGPNYHFYQVKTKSKANHLWSLREVFELKKSGQKADKD